MNPGADHPRAGRGMLVSSPWVPWSCGMHSPAGSSCSWGTGSSAEDLPAFRHRSLGEREARRAPGCRLACAGEFRRGHREWDGEWLWGCFEKPGCLLQLGRALGLCLCEQSQAPRSAGGCVCLAQMFPFQNNSRKSAITARLCRGLREPHVSRVRCSSASR